MIHMIRETIRQSQKGHLLNQLKAFLWFSFLDTFTAKKVQKLQPLWQEMTHFDILIKLIWL